MASNFRKNIITNISMYLKCGCRKIDCFRECHSSIIIRDVIEHFPVGVLTVFVRELTSFSDDCVLYKHRNVYMLHGHVHLHGIMLCI